MANNVSLSGGIDSGATLTLSITSADNAAVAQTALSSIAAAVAGGQLTQVNLGPASTEPLPVAAGPSVVVEQSSVALAPFELGNGYVAAVLDGSAPQEVATGLAPNETIVSGSAGAVVGNFATGTEVVFGGGNNSFATFDGIGNDPSASVWLDGNGSFDLSLGETTVYMGAGAALVLVDDDSIAANVVNLENTDAKAAPNLIGLGGTGTAAATVNAAGAGLAVLQNGGAGLINADSSNVTIYGGGGPGWNGAGSVTLYGGGGTDMVDQGAGLFEAGSGGGSLLIGSSLPGAATLIGGGEGDTLLGLGSGDVLIAGPGNETLSGGGAPIVAMGDTGSAPSGAITSMVGGASGGNFFAIGNGNTEITGNHGSAGGNLYAELTSGANSAVINDFISGLDPAGVPQANADVIALWQPGGGAWQFEQGAAPGAGQVTYQYAEVNGVLSSVVQFGDGATWTLPGAVVHPGDFM